MLRARLPPRASNLNLSNKIYLKPYCSVDVLEACLPPYASNLNLSNKIHLKTILFCRRARSMPSPSRLELESLKQNPPKTILFCRCAMFLQCSLGTIAEMHLAFLLYIFSQRPTGGSWHLNTSRFVTFSSVWLARSRSAVRKPSSITG